MKKFILINLLVILTFIFVTFRYSWAEHARHTLTPQEEEIFNEIFIEAMNDEEEGWQDVVVLDEGLTIKQNITSVHFLWTETFHGQSTVAVNLGFIASYYENNLLIDKAKLLQRVYFTIDWDTKTLIEWYSNSSERLQTLNPDMEI